MNSGYHKFLFISVLSLSSCMAWAQNPVIDAMYTPDPAPYVHDGKVYLFVDRDEELFDFDCWELKY